MTYLNLLNNSNCHMTHKRTAYNSLKRTIKFFLDYAALNVNSECTGAYRNMTVLNFIINK